MEKPYAPMDDGKPSVVSVCVRACLCVYARAPVRPSVCACVCASTHRWLSWTPFAVDTAPGWNGLKPPKSLCT